MDIQWMKLKEYLQDRVDEYNKKFCSFNEIIEIQGIKKVLEKMDELENG